MLKLARNTLFLSKDIIVLDSDRVSCLISTALHLSTAKSEHFDCNILKKIINVCTCQRKLCS